MAEPFTNITSAFANIQPSSPLLSQNVPGDPKLLNLQQNNTIATAYGNAGMDRNALLKGIENNRKLEEKKVAATAMKLKTESQEKWLKETITDASRDGRNSISNYKKAAKAPELEYVTASQAKLYIGGILVDECYDLQYQYKEYKEPVYGYNDKHYAAVLKGNVIISGTFTINYKHDAYLVKLLEKINEKGTTGDADEAWLRKELIESDTKNYRAALEAYRADFKKLAPLQKNIKARAIELEEFKAEIKSYNSTPARIEQDFSLKKANLQKQKDAFMASLSAGDKAKVLQDESNFVNATDAYRRSTSENSQELEMLEKKLEIINDEIKSLTDAVTTLENPSNNWDASPEDKRVNGEKLVKLLSQIADLNKRKTALLGDIDYTKKLCVESTSQDSVLVGNTLNANSKQWVAFGLQAKKLDAEKNSASKDIESRKTEVERWLKELEASDKADNAAVLELQRGLEKTKVRLNGLAEKLNELNSLVVEAAMNPEYALKNKDRRAEDYGTWGGDKFVMFVEYNGSIHKIIEGCTLTGHGHVVAQGGEVIKEYYTFIAQSIR